VILAYDKVGPVITNLKQPTRRDGQVTKAIHGRLQDGLVKEQPSDRPIPPAVAGRQPSLRDEFSPAFATNRAVHRGDVA